MELEQSVSTMPVVLMMENEGDPNTYSMDVVVIPQIDSLVLGSIVSSFDSFYKVVAFGWEVEPFNGQEAILRSVWLKLTDLINEDVYPNAFPPEEE